MNKEDCFSKAQENAFMIKKTEDGVTNFYQKVYIKLNKKEIESPFLIKVIGFNDKNEFLYSYYMNRQDFNTKNKEEIRMEFEVGDKVKFVGNTEDHILEESLKQILELYNNVFTIKKKFIRNNYVNYVICEDTGNHWDFAENELELVSRNNYKDRFITEYKELKSRLDKLHKMIIKYKAETLDFEPDCPIGVLEDQEYYMSEYLKVLEIRAEIEKINLD